MKTLKQIQAEVRLYARDGALDLITTGSEGLRSVNRIYRALSGLLPWGELRREDTTITTTGGTAKYTWPSFPTSPRFIDVKMIEIQNNDDQDRYTPITTPVDETTWSASGRKPNQTVPDHYMRVSTSSANQIEFRPAPKFAKTIRITGIIEPDPFTKSGQQSYFLSMVADDAFEYFIAASWINRDGADDRYAALLAANASDLLSTLFDIDEVTQEMLRRVVLTDNRLVLTNNQAG